MTGGTIVKEVIVHPVDGMQLAAGYIRMDESQQYVGNLPGMAALIGDSVEDVLRLLDRTAKAFYGDDVIVEVVHHLSTA